jgi:hypothetical protein
MENVELEGRNAREMVIHALFGFFTQQVVLLTHKTCTYIGRIDNARHSVVAVTEETGYRVKQRERDNKLRVLHPVRETSDHG